MNAAMEQLKRNLREARDHSYLGRYEESQKQFKRIVDSIEHEIVMNNVDKRTIEDWRKFEKQVLEEKRLVESIISMLSGITFENKSRFEQVEFDQSRETKYRFYQQQQPPAVRQPRNMSNARIKKDPDIWDPPSPQEQRATVKKVSIRKNVPNRSVVDPPPNQKGYEKPWQANSKQSNQKPAANTQAGGKDGKSFLLDRYPDGQGPDSNLIQMLEREVIDFNPNITFDDIAELETAKGLLQQAVLLPLKMPQFFTGIRRAWKGVLMFGPPGTGKTLLAKAIASTGKTTFFNVSASSLASKWKGESEKLVRILFEMAKFYAPTTIFFDEIDSLGSKRSEGQDESSRKVKSQLLVQMDGASNGDTQGEKKYVMVLAATNRPWDLDEALRRRLEKRIYIPLPTEKGRKQLLRINLKDVHVAQNVNMDDIVRRTDGYSGADITNVCRQAAYMPMRKKLKQQGGFKNIQNIANFQKQVNIPLTVQDFSQALKNVNKSVGTQDLQKYDRWMKEFGSV